MRVSILFLVFLFVPQIQSFAKEPITVKILNWWDYLADPAAKRLREKGYNIEINIYKSNDVAISQLVNTRSKFDIAIVSNQVLEPLLKANIIKSGPLQPIFKKRSYYPFLKRTPYCLPYLWSSTVYATNANLKPTKVDSIEKLIQLKSKNINIGIIDDKLEVIHRILGDQSTVCGKKLIPSNIFRSYKKCKNPLPRKTVDQMSPEDFISGIYEILSKPNSAAYGWHGEAALALKDSPNLQFITSAKNPVIGYDSVCIINNSHTQIPTKKLVEFATLLTDKKNTFLNIKAFQYFSPYMNDERGLKPKIKNLRKQVSKKMSESTAIFIKPPPNDQHKTINKWWKGVRYKK